jgi:hypothetical protein
MRRDQDPSPTVKRLGEKERRGTVLIAKLVPAALIALLVLGFAANEAKVKDPNADRVAKKCEMENITDVQARECGIRSAMQARNGQRLSQTQTDR